MSTLNGNLELLLANATDLAPAIADGLSDRALAHLPRLRVRGGTFDNMESRQPTSFGDTGDSNDLRSQRWGVVAPEGPIGDRLLDIIRPLIALREAEQRAAAIIYRVPNGMDSSSSLEWRDDVLHGEGDEESPRYLFVLGNVDSISVDFQDVLSETTFIGRFHGETDAAYEAYVEKVCHWAQTPPDTIAPRIVFHVAQDGTAATAMAQRNLIMPCKELMMARMRSQESLMVNLSSLDDHVVLRDEFVNVGHSMVPSILLSVCNGIGAPLEGWASPKDCRMRQGNLLLAPDEVLNASDVHTGLFYPGGVWINLASFSAATLEYSIYGRWLNDVAAIDTDYGVTDCLRMNLSDSPFLSALAMAALANPEGPLAFIGKKDLAWMYAPVETERRKRDASHAIHQVLLALARGSRVGVAFKEIGRIQLETNDDLMAMFERDARQSQEQPDSIHFARRAFAWLLRNDLQSYMLLGDPAVRLPGTKGRGA